MNFLTLYPSYDLYPDTSVRIGNNEIKLLAINILTRLTLKQDTHTLFMIRFIFYKNYIRHVTYYVI